MTFLEPAEDSVAEIEIKKSRFIGRVRRVDSPEAARQAVREEKAAHPSARHVVHAFVIGGPNSESSGLSDDGEPKGTAGRPVFEVLKGSGVCNALLTVVRYFGGVKLGTGGLVRAYTECAQAALRGLETRPVVNLAEFTAELSYGHYDAVKKVLDSAGAEIEDEAFGETVVLTGKVPEGSADDAARAVMDATRGQTSLRFTKTEND